jgi:hypothetical protein
VNSLEKFNRWWGVLIGCAVCIALGIAALVMHWTSWASLVWLVLGGSLVVFSATRMGGKEDGAWLGGWVAARVAIGSIVAVGIAWQVGDDLITDARMYLSVGSRLAHVWTTGQATLPWEVLSNYVVGYFVVVAAQLSIVPDQIFVVITNVLLGAHGTAMVYSIANEVGGHRVARIASVLSLIDPVGIVFCGFNMKEAIALWLLMAFVLALVRLVTRRRWGWLLVVMSISLAMGMIRPYLVVLWVMVLVPVVVVVPRRTTHRVMVGGAAFASAIVLGIAAWWVIGGVVKALAQGSLSEMLDMIQFGMTGKGQAGLGTESGMLGEARLESPGAILKFLPVGIARQFISPIPWKTAESWYKLLIPGMLMRYAFWPFFFLGMWTCVADRSRARMVLVSVALGTLAMYGVITLGSSIRHVTQFAPLTMIFAALGYVHRDRFEVVTPLLYFVIVTGLFITTTGVYAGVMYFLPLIGMATLVLTWWFRSRATLRLQG